MRGIVVKPAPCCGSTKSLGKMVQKVAIPKKALYTVCQSCGDRKSITIGYVGIKFLGETEERVTTESRVKWFNEDLDKQIQQEDNVQQIKEKEGA